MKRFVFVVAMILGALLFTVAVAAEEDGASIENEKVVKLVDKANEKIDQEIDWAIEQSDQILANFQAGLITEDEKDKKIDKIVAKLLRKTNRISERAKEKALAYGSVIACEYIEVMIDNQVILVDPLFIIGT